MASRIYIGYLRDSGKPVILSTDCPTEERHGASLAGLVGPFRTKRAARFMIETFPNPHCRTVADAERLSVASRNKS